MIPTWVCWNCAQRNVYWRNRCWRCGTLKDKDLSQKDKVEKKD